MSEYAFIRFVTDFTGEFVNVGAMASSGEIHAAMIVKDLTRALALDDLERCDESWMRAFLEPIAERFRRSTDSIHEFIRLNDLGGCVTFSSVATHSFAPCEAVTDLIASNHLSRGHRPTMIVASCGSYDEWMAEAEPELHSVVAALKSVRDSQRELGVIEAHLVSAGREIMSISDTEPDPACLLPADEIDHFS